MASYDPNGNLTSLTRTGTRAETLAYTYTSGTNKLGTLKSNGTNKTYAYYADGTMKTDGLRGLTVTYNALKLPKTVANGTTSTVTCIYDAEGNKLAVSQDGTVKNYYCGDFVYTSGLAVDYILTPNGQMTRNQGTGAYTAQYNITDHLGNVRSVVNSSGTVLQSTDYYPFGLAFSDANVTNNRYLYNGKELENYTIGSSYLGTLDYGARHYDPRIGRWTVPDPMAEKYYGLSSFAYCAGNPVMMVDVDGNNPIFGLDGSFLGVDDIGLQGTPIIMDISDYFENMSHNLAMSLDLGISSIEANEDAMKRFNDVYYSLSQRPDWDGYLTLEEANEWYRNGQGQPLYVSLQQIDLSRLASLGDNYIGSEKVVSLFLAGNNLNNSLVFGSVKLRRYPNNAVRAFSDTYDFDMKPWWLVHKWPRNIETLIGKRIAGGGTAYSIIIYGEKELTPLLPWIK